MPSTRRPGRTARLLGSAAVAAAAALVLAACGAGATATNTSAGAGSSAGATKATALITKLQKPVTAWPAATAIKNPVSLAGKSVMIIPLGDTIPVMHGMSLGAKQALEHLGANVSVCDGKINPTDVASCLQQAQSQHDYAVISYFVAYPMDANAFNAVAASGTKVLIAGDSPVAGTHYPANLSFFDFGPSLQTLSADEAAAAVADKGTGANVIWIGQTDSADTIAQADAGQKRFQQLCPSCGFVLARYSTANANQLPSTISALLVSHPNTNVVVMPVDTVVANVLPGIQSAGYLNKVELIATGSDLAGLQRVAAGGQAHDFAAPVIYDGYATVNGLMQQAAGEKVAPLTNVTSDITKGNVGGLQLNDAAYFTSDWFGNDSFEKAFYTAWGTK